MQTFGGDLIRKLLSKLCDINDKKNPRIEIEENTLYVIFAILGIMLLLLARIPSGYGWGENILDGLGCSCISAAIMAYFINIILRLKNFF